MPKSYLPTVKKIDRTPKGDWNFPNPANPNYLFGFVSNLAGVGIRLRAGRIFIDIDKDKIALVPPDDWAEIQAAVGLLGEERSGEDKGEKA